MCPTYTHRDTESTLNCLDVAQNVLLRISECAVHIVYMPSSVDSPSENPLKKLRMIVGLPQQEFAELIGFAWDTIRAVEIGRRGLTEERLAQIQASIGAIWDPHNREWYFDPGGLSGRRIKYAREHFETFRLELRAEARQRSLLVYYLTLRFHDLCSSIPDAAFNGWFWRLEQHFDKWSSEFKLETKPEFEFDLQPLWDSELGRTVGYVKVFPGLLNGEEKTVWLKMVEAAREGKQQMFNRAFPKKMTVPKTTRSKVA
jgi:transcriptional regulator with XRE-family HTH domain